MGRGAADGRFARGQFPLRDAGADLDIYRGGVSILCFVRESRRGWRDKSRDDAAKATYSNTFGICGLCQFRVAGHAVRRRGSQRVFYYAWERETYELSHCAIQPAGSLGSVGSVGPESGETGGMGGVGTAMSLVWRAGDGGVQRGDAIGREEEEYKRDSV